MSTRRTRWSAALAGAAALLTVGTVAGCSGSGSGGGTSTATVTVKATKTSAGAGASGTPSATPTSAASDVKGRRFDAGVVVGVKHGGGLTILVLDRWTVKGLSDSTLASKGAPVTPHSDVRYVNENSKSTYRVPVNPTATIVVNTCDDSTKPPTMTSTPVTLQTFLDRPNRTKTVVLLAYDDTGRLTRLDTDPAC